MTVAAAYAACRRLARRHYENFPVASRLVPQPQRDALAAIYAFARGADDFADEPGVQDRLGNLVNWRRKLDDCFDSKADNPIFVALLDTVRKFSLAKEPFTRLLRAFEMDARGATFPDFGALLDYCSCSANPVGELVLALFGHREAELIEMSDAICTALQLTNFWQDVAVDWQRHHVYIPGEDFKRFDYSLQDLEARRADENWRRLMAFEISRTRQMFARGRLLPERVAPGLRRQLRMTWLGGAAILSKIESLEYDTLHRRPSLSKREMLRLYWRSRTAFPISAPEDAVSSFAS